VLLIVLAAIKRSSQVVCSTIKNSTNLVNDLSMELDKTGVRFSLPPPAAFGRLFLFD